MPDQMTLRKVILERRGEASGDRSSYGYSAFVTNFDFVEQSSGKNVRNCVQTYLEPTKVITRHSLPRSSGAGGVWTNLDRGRISFIIHSVQCSMVYKRNVRDLPPAAFRICGRPTLCNPHSQGGIVGHDQGYRFKTVTDCQISDRTINEFLSQGALLEANSPK